ncbi:hypothetical protein H6F42_15910 [Pseudanabaena sp. FACHB-1998]|uniref:hypothetical protein n=1 Tax=Pseudanabaena sp. FACHB-1998 TaxID=2692858 RepID=UPI001680FFE4|nr:hypothetical protein [Pseudanabaena sp. FACHB-1998]MBD2178405.1 hypothetical protein [Pseudanabaena sp. FACHB-1998]
MAVDFANDANWITVYQLTTSGDIPPLVVNQSLSYRFLRIIAENSEAKASWTLGGYLNFLTDEAIAPDLIGDRVFCDVNKAKIIQVPDWIGAYRLKFKPPVWFNELSLQVDGYIGGA